MHRALAIAVVELDAVGGGAAEERGVEEIGASRAPGHRNAAAGAHRCQHRLGAGGHIAAGTRDHDPDRVEEVPPRVMADLVVERVMAQPAHETDQRRGGAGGRHAPACRAVQPYDMADVSNREPISFASSR